MIGGKAANTNFTVFGLTWPWLVRDSSAVWRLLWICCCRGTSESYTYGKQRICFSNSWSAHFHVSWLSDFIFYQNPRSTGFTWPWLEPTIYWIYPTMAWTHELLDLPDHGLNPRSTGFTQPWLEPTIYWIYPTMAWTHDLPHLRQAPQPIHNCFGGMTFYPNTASNYIISIILRCFMNN
jgi:hypothetical protein